MRWFLTIVMARSSLSTSSLACTLGSEDQASWANQQPLDARSAAQAEDLIPESTFTKEDLISFTPIAKVAHLEELKILKLTSGIGLTCRGDRAKTIVHKYLLGHWRKKKLHECLR
jgi:hypothetical protein